MRFSFKHVEDLSRRPYVQGLPEWSMFPDEATRRKAIVEIERGMMPRSLRGLLQFLLAVAIFLAAPLAISHLIAMYALRSMGFWNGRIMLAMTLAGYTVLVYLALRRDMPKAMRGQLINAGVPVCIKCGYDLRGLPADRTQCPECGRDFDAEILSLLRDAQNPATLPVDASSDVRG